LIASQILFFSCNTPPTNKIGISFITSYLMITYIFMCIIYFMKFLKLHFLNIINEVNKYIYCYLCKIH
jgi:hypothetical protein